jgi:hypothetical protein
MDGPRFSLSKVGGWVLIGLACSLASCADQPDRALYEKAQKQCEETGGTWSAASTSFGAPAYCLRSGETKQ